MIKKNSFTFVEVLIVAVLFVILTGGIFTVLSIGRNSWQQTDVAIELQQDLRQAMARVGKELRESGFDSLGNPKITISDNTGVNNSDILTFQIPVDGDGDGDIVDVNGNIEWGGAILWANKDPSDQHFGYQIEYLINDQNQFIRKSIDDSNGLVREDNYANNIIDFQVTPVVAPLSADDPVVNIEITARKDTVFGRTITRSLSSDIYLRNQN